MGVIELELLRPVVPSFAFDMSPSTTQGGAASVAPQAQGPSADEAPLLSADVARSDASAAPQAPGPSADEAPLLSADVARSDAPAVTTKVEPTKDPASAASSTGRFAAAAFVISAIIALGVWVASAQPTPQDEPDYEPIIRVTASFRMGGRAESFDVAGVRAALMDRFPNATDDFVTVTDAVGYDPDRRRLQSSVYPLAPAPAPEPDEVDVEAVFVISDVFPNLCASVGQPALATPTFVQPFIQPYLDLGVGKCQLAAGGMPSHDYLHGIGDESCQAACDNDPNCCGFSVAGRNCLTWNEPSLVAASSSAHLWGDAHCQAKTTNPVCNAYAPPPAARGCAALRERLAPIVSCIREARASAGDERRWEAIMSCLPDAFRERGASIVRRFTDTPIREIASRWFANVNGGDGVDLKLLPSLNIEALISVVRNREAAVRPILDAVARARAVPPRVDPKWAYLPVKPSTATPAPPSSESTCECHVCGSSSPWDFPPAGQVCGASSDVCSATMDCYEAGSSASYRGFKDTTVSGRKCQHWPVQIPHRHSQTLGSNGLPDGNQTHNYCRDPDGSKGQPWCYTADRDVTWEMCGVSECPTSSALGCYFTGEGNLGDKLCHCPACKQCMSPAPCACLSCDGLPTDVKHCTTKELGCPRDASGEGDARHCKVSLRKNIVRDNGNRLEEEVMRFYTSQKRVYEGKPASAFEDVIEEFKAESVPANSNACNRLVLYDEDWGCGIEGDDSKTWIGDFDWKKLNGDRTLATLARAHRPLASIII